MKERGFFHPAQGYWQVSGDVPDHILAGYPGGTVEAPVRPAGDGYAFEGGVWVATAAPTAAEVLANAKERAHRSIVAWIDEFLAPFTAGLPRDEVASWPTKAAAAEIHLAGKPHAMILAEAAVTGEDADDLARSIVVRADKTSAIMAATAGLRRKTAAAIGAAETNEAIASALDDAQKTALAMAAQMGLPLEIK